MVKVNLNEKNYLELISLFIKKQVFCEKMINSGLSFVKGTSLLRKKVLLGSQGFITKKPSWRFYFHGNGVRLTNNKTKETIDYDYLSPIIKGKRQIGGFDSWRLSLFTKNQIDINNLDGKIYSPLTKQEKWEDILIELEKQGFIIKSLDTPLYKLKKYKNIIYKKLIQVNKLNEIRKIMNKHDPAGVYYGEEVNFDEYDPEIELILEMYHKDINIYTFKQNLILIFNKMFGSYKINEDIILRLSNELYAYLKDKNRHNRKEDEKAEFL